MNGQAGKGGGRRIGEDTEAIRNNYDIIDWGEKMQVICKHAEICSPVVNCSHAKPHDPEAIKYNSESGSIYCESPEFCRTANEDVWCEEVKG